MEVKIPFQECWRGAMLEQHKVCTSRNKRYGKPGDTFQAFEAEFEIVAVAKITLQDVSSNLYIQEGCSSPEELERLWADLHPRRGFLPEQPVYVHWFIKT
jgi:hypothetical protein